MSIGRPSGGARSVWRPLPLTLLASLGLVHHEACSLRGQLYSHATSDQPDAASRWPLRVLAFNDFDTSPATMRALVSVYHVVYFTSGRRSCVSLGLIAHGGHQDHYQNLLRACGSASVPFGLLCTSLPCQKRWIFAYVAALLLRLRRA